MARVTVRTSTVPVSGSLDELFPNLHGILDAAGKRAVQHVQSGLWADRNFKRVTGKSRRAWSFARHAHGIGLDLTNDATNRGSTPYAQYVHYAGTPRSAVVVDKVQVMLDQRIAPDLVAALQRDYEAGLKRRKPKTTTKTFGSR